MKKSVQLWLSTDPLQEKYPSYSSYTYVMNNPTKYVDPDGKSTWVVNIGGGKYQVVGGNFNDGNSNIYIGSLDHNGSYAHNENLILGKSISTRSFYNDTPNPENYGKDHGWMGIIDTNNDSGANFLSYMESASMSIEYYGPLATPNQPLDFKKTNNEGKGVIFSSELGFYRGMPLAQEGAFTVYGSGRDVGNISAGYVGAQNGLTWEEARLGFDGLQSLQQGAFVKEGLSTQNAQKYGYDYMRSKMSDSSWNYARVKRFGGIEGIDLIRSITSRDDD